MDYSHIQFSTDKSKVDFQQLKELYNQTTFWAKERDIQDLEKAIAFSEPVVTVWDNDRLMGCARATSDGVYRATVWDVVIHPDYQGSGLGRKLVETVITHPHLSHVERVYLMTTHKQDFYKKIGFEENKTTTMVLHNNQDYNTDNFITEFAEKDQQKVVELVTV